MAIEEETYPVGRVSRLTGVSPDVLRAWERRYGAVTPVRTPGGTRRYRAEDIDRLRLLRAAVESGHRIGEVATLSVEELERRVAEPAPRAAAPIGETLEALGSLDGTAVEDQIAGQLAALGPVRFAKEFAIPLLEKIGEEWKEQRLCVASEHLGSALLRSLLGAALRSWVAHRDAPIVVFGTPPGERHELGLLAAALSALGAGARPLYLGPDLPVEELVGAAKRAAAAALALSAVTKPAAQLEDELRSIREALPSNVEVWLGGSGAARVNPPQGVLVIESLARLEQRVELLRVASRR